MHSQQVWILHEQNLTSCFSGAVSSMFCTWSWGMEIAELSCINQIDLCQHSGSNSHYHMVNRLHSRANEFFPSNTGFWVAEHFSHTSFAISASLCLKSVKCKGIWSEAVTFLWFNKLQCFTGVALDSSSQYFFSSWEELQMKMSWCNLPSLSTTFTYRNFVVTGVTKSWEAKPAACIVVFFSQQIWAHQG